MSEAAACVPNIGSKEIRKRLRRAMVVLAVGVGVAAVMILAGVERGWRLALLVPFWLAALDYFQAREKT
ncbi:MAG: hypothetical protein ACE5IP_12650 [Terriglobia bacterium]